jgi:hypothetical protein
MAKNKISEWSSTAASNTDIGGIDIAEGCAPSGINNAIRELMAQVKDQQAGTDADNFTVGGNLSVTGTSTLTGAVTATAGVTGNLTGNVTGNVTGNTSGTAANVTGTVAVANGGTGLTTLTANNVMLGNGTSAPTFVAPGTSGNVLTSNGTTWASTAPTGGIGSSQSWTDVTSTRSAGTTYTNSTGKPIFVSVYTNLANNAVTYSFTVAGVVVQSAQIGQSGYGVPSALTIGGIVPNGATYSISLTNTSVNEWIELR